MLIKRQHTRRVGDGGGGEREKFKHNLYDLPMRQSRRGVPKMLFMARSMAREGRCCQLDCPRADGLFTPDFGLLLYVVCPSQLGWIDCPVAHIDEIVWGTTPGAKGRRRREGDGSEWRQQSQWNFFDRVGQTETENVGGNRVWPWLTAAVAMAVWLLPLCYPAKQSTARAGF